MKILEYINPLTLYNPRKPAGRLVFLWGLIYGAFLLQVFMAVVGGITTEKTYALSSDFSDAITTVILIVYLCGYFIPPFIMVIRRLRDLKEPTGQVVVALIPLVNLVFLLHLLFSPGEHDESSRSEVEVAPSGQ
jgi:uncharacterized membrane protein YhaH (DUF805 family)